MVPESKILLDQNFFKEFIFVCELKDHLYKDITYLRDFRKYVTQISNSSFTYIIPEKKRPTSDIHKSFLMEIGNHF